MLYGSQKSTAWSSEEFAGLLADKRLHQTRFRWCNMGNRAPVSGLGLNPVVRIVSTMPLWSGAPTESARCHCQSHASLTEFSEGEVSAARQ